MDLLAALDIMRRKPATNTIGLQVRVQMVAFEDPNWKAGVSRKLR